MKSDDDDLHQKHEASQMTLDKKVAWRAKPVAAEALRGKQFIAASEHLLAKTGVYETTQTGSHSPATHPIR